MSEQLESASKSFTDSSGDIYEARRYADVIELERNWDDDTPSTIRFWSKDATKIIALIAEAAKDEPRVLSQQEVADFARRWDARVEEGRAVDTDKLLSDVQERFGVSK